MNAPEEQIILIDIEASSLSDTSYPIEIAWGESTKTIQAILIDPSDVPSWTDWNARAEDLHGISRSQLANEGVSPYVAYKTINNIFSRGMVFSDDPDFDYHWLEAFNRLPGCNTSDWKVHDFFELRHILPDLQGVSRHSLSKAIKDVKSLLENRHRAAPDVLALFKAIEIAKNM